MELTTIDRFLSWVHSEWQKLTGEAKKVSTEANTITNAIKNWAASPEGTTIDNMVESLGEVVLPGLTNAFKLWVPQLFKALNFASNAAGYLTDDHIVAQGLAYLNSTTGDIRATQLNALAANIATWKAQNQGVLDLPIQTALMMAPVVYRDSKTEAPAPAATFQGSGSDGVAATTGTGAGSDTNAETSQTGTAGTTDQTTNGTEANMVATPAEQVASTDTPFGADFSNQPAAPAGTTEQPAPFGSEHN